ncbi:sesquipedalian [Anaeramoeba flamelloides]|uniref:Sesquipedalian n=1 Tax=Anaeramoeba flamelloides TaxID=1746091 RepID=A0AAV8A501_9EUKA|nr:sesquipedalian [Anaeramoeba flamelloides]
MDRFGQKPQFQGILNKTSSNWKGWKKRYLIIVGQIIYVFKSEKDYKNAKVPLESLLLANCKLEISEPPKKKTKKTNKFYFKITNQIGTTESLMCDSQSEGGVWYSQISKAITSNSQQTKRMGMNLIPLSELGKSNKDLGKGLFGSNLRFSNRERDLKYIPIEIQLMKNLFSFDQKKIFFCGIFKFGYTKYLPLDQRIFVMSNYDLKIIPLVENPLVNTIVIPFNSISKLEMFTNTDKQYKISIQQEKEKEKKQIVLTTDSIFDVLSFYIIMEILSKRIYSNAFIESKIQKFKLSPRILQTICIKFLDILNTLLVKNIKMFDLNYFMNNKSKIFDQLLNILKNTESIDDIEKLENNLINSVSLFALFFMCNWLLPDPIILPKLSEHFFMKDENIEIKTEKLADLFSNFSNQVYYIFSIVFSSSNYLYKSFKNPIFLEQMARVLSQIYHFFPINENHDSFQIMINQNLQITTLKEMIKNSKKIFPTNREKSSLTKKQQQMKIMSLQPEVKKQDNWKEKKIEEIKKVYEKNNSNNEKNEKKFCVYMQEDESYESDDDEETFFETLFLEKHQYHQPPLPLVQPNLDYSHNISKSSKKRKNKILMSKSDRILTILGNNFQNCDFIESNLLKFQKSESGIEASLLLETILETLSLELSLISKDCANNYSEFNQIKQLIDRNDLETNKNIK